MKAPAPLSTTAQTGCRGTRLDQVDPSELGTTPVSMTARQILGSDHNGIGSEQHPQLCDDTVATVDGVLVGQPDHPTIAEMQFDR